MDKQNQDKFEQNGKLWYNQQAKNKVEDSLKSASHEEFKLNLLFEVKYSFYFYVFIFIYFYFKTASRFELRYGHSTFSQI